MKKINRDKTLKRILLQRKWKNCSRYIYIGILCILCFVLGIYFTYSKFFTVKEQEVIQTKVGDFIYGDVVIGTYIDGEYSNTVPSKSDGYTVESVSCDNGATGKWDSSEWGLTTKNITKRTKCNIYFTKPSSKISQIIAKLDTTGKCPNVNEDGSINITGPESSAGYLCQAKDTYGTSYYYRGNVTDNYVYFAGYYWRIVRINGDETVRIIYDGTVAHSNDEASTDRQIGTSTFNNNYDDNTYVGYMYGLTGGSNYASSHTNTYSTTIKTYIDNWYKTNIVGTTNEKYIVDNIFCNDKSFATNNTGTGAGTSITYYRWYTGPWESNGYNAKMKLICPQKNDAFTVSDVLNGNGALTYPIGLLTTDEAVLAGGFNEANNNYYLYSGNWYWTLSAYYFNLSSATMRCVGSNGYANISYRVNNNGGVRPVLNVSSEVLSKGTGTISDPYRLSSDN